MRDRRDRRWIERPSALPRWLASAIALAALAAPGARAAAQTRVDNPYLGAAVYVNPEWSTRAAAEPGGAAVAGQPTAVWLDRIAAIAGTGGARGLRAHLDEALRQAQAAARPLVFQTVIYDLPGRDCAALASNGELGPTELPRYKTEYIDAIAAILSDPRYASLRVVAIIEIDSLPNLVTNVTPRPTATLQCDVMKANGNYVNGIGYALAKLGAIGNVYSYIDAAHHGWIGWDDNFGATAQILLQAASASGSTVANVAGIITNTANYSALVEPFFTIDDVVNGQRVRESSSWIDFNRYVDELSFAQAFRQELIRVGFRSDIGVLIDTSRNGWGGAARPTGPGPTTSANAYVDGGRLDRRIHLGNWCNQSGAGLGERPTAAPAAGIDAYVWIKPPGESDGASTEIPNDEGKGFDRMCDPTYGGNARNNFHMSGALPDAPLSGHWFPAQFHELLQNAFPPLTDLPPPPPDTQPPTAPAGLAVSSRTSTSVSLTWTASTDNARVAGYRILEGTAVVGSSAVTSFTVTGLAPSSTHTYRVVAFDPSDNVSPASDAVTATTSPPGVASLKVQYRAGNQSAGDNQLGPHFDIVNTGTETAALSGVTLRYWYTVDGVRPQNFWCDYTPRGCGNLSAAFVALSPARARADSYLEIGFTAGMGSLSPGQSTGEIQTRVSKDNWTSYDESNDHSSDLTRTSFADWDRVTLYQNGALVWGVEPAASASAARPSSADNDVGAGDGCQAAPGRASALLALLVGLLACLARSRRLPRRPRRAGLLALLVAGSLGAAGCLGGDASDDEPGRASAAVSAGGVTVDVVATDVWSGGFNGAVRIANVSFPAPITSFQVVFQLGGTASITGTPWNGTISPPDASGNRTAANPSWLATNPITTGRTWDVGFNASGVFAGGAIVAISMNGQTIPIGGDGDRMPPAVSLAASATSMTSAGPLTLTATATDDRGVTRVEFLDGSQLLGADGSAPFSITVDLTSAQNGTHTYRARALDAAGNAGTSSPVTVTVDIAGGGGRPVYSTSGGRLFRDGAELRLFGLNWFGLETSDRVLHGLWTGRQLAAFLTDFKSKGFNALRLPVSPQTINSGFPISGAGPTQGDDGAALRGRDGRAALEYTLARAQAAGMFVLVDFHTCDPARLGAGLPGSPIACSGYSLSSWLNDMRTLAALSLTYTNMVGIDLTNEPHALTWSDWSGLAGQAGQAILAVNPNLTIWVEGVGNASANGGFAANWGGNLFEAGAIPGIPANRLVLSPHSYGPSVASQSYFGAPNYPDNMPAIWDTLFGHVVNQGFTMVTGEFGGRYTTSSTPSQNDRLWQDRFVTYLLGKGTRGFFYWAVNPNSGDTGGIYLDDWATWNQDKLTLLQRLMTP